MKLSLSLITMLMAIQFTVAQTLKPVQYKDGEQKLNGFVTSNTGKKLPGVLVLPAWQGIDKEAKNAALELQKAGYIAFVADIYGEGNVPTDNASAGKIAGKYKEDYKAYQKRISLALDQLKKAGANVDKIAVIGYCFGGTGVLEVARANFPVVGVVSIHGGLAKDPARENMPIKTKVLVENGADDGGVTPEVVAALTKELNVGKTDWQMITYSNSKHTFTNPESPDYNDVMSKRAWDHTMMFLAEILK
ncbi:dienelactone hydrolase family protein [Halpernia frigidisoli]|uniref:Dienelactone hydrolase n=1 Tax=Halpernia frigidisoli TaxID=1125876 RepID=A0A1I3FPG7_9FLAO|nr:dienelactone hydrolase family protein [Halpernia frigidisoli]SFI13056.1 Dienelactone hydrolase [Halpernia frigidisoli]